MEMLRTTLILCAMFLAVGMANAEPLKLTDTQMDMVTAGDLGLPNGKVIFAGFDNQAPVGAHPSFYRDNRELDLVTFEEFYGSNAYTNSGNEGPWSAAFNSPVIYCLGC
jgi:hypothetical protein